MINTLNGRIHCDSSGDQNEKCIIANRGKFIPVEEIFKMKFPKESWLWEKMIPYGHVTVLASAADVGKSILCRQISTSLSLRKDDLFGIKLNPKSGRVLYISTEDQLPDWKDRLERFDFSEENKEMIGKKLLVCTDCSNILPELERELTANPTDLVVIDVMGDAYEEDLNNTVQVRQFYKPYKELAAKSSTAILFVHHITKVGEDKGGFSKTQILGSTSVSGGPRSVIQMVRDRNNEHLRLLKVSKGNLVSDSTKDRVLTLSLDEKLSFVLVSEKVAPQNNVPAIDPAEDAIKELINSGLTKARIVTEACSRGIAGRTKVYQIINKLNQTGNDRSSKFCTKNQIV